MSQKGRPINADVPPVDAEKASPDAPPKAEPGPPKKAAETPRKPSPPAPTTPKSPPPSPSPAPPKPPTSPKTTAPEKAPAPSGKAAKSTGRRRRPIPTALKGIAGLVLIAVVFIVAAILGGGSDSGGGSIPSAAPTPDQTTTESKPATPTQAASELGYPEFATNNTTRVGGADPASNAAAVALAVFPAQTETQQPDTVTLVNGADWQTATAAAVLMAEPLRSPLLVSEADGLPDATTAALDALAPPGATEGSAQVFTIAGAAAPSDLKAIPVKRAGAAGAAAIARLRDKLLGGPPRHIVIAPTAEPAFAMPAAAWAARSGDPVLFSGRGRLPKPTATVLEQHPKVPVYVLGPSSAISSETVRQITDLSRDVSRVSGEDPVSNAIALARYADGDFGWNVNDPGHGFVVARSDSPLDAAAAAPLSASGTWGPLLLTDSADTLPAALRDYLLDVKPGYTTDPTRAFYNHVWLIGNQDAIDVNQQAQINELAELARIGGGP